MFALSLATWHGMRIVSSYILRWRRYSVSSVLHVLLAADIEPSSPPVQILQLTSLLPTAEHFSILLRDALKSQLSQMKQLKPFTPSLYSEFLLSAGAANVSAPAPSQQPIDLISLGSDLSQSQSNGETSTQNPAANGALSLSDPKGSIGDMRGPGGEGKGKYARGLGEKFGYPGDARKLRERSKIKLWREYFEVHGRNLTSEYCSQM